MVVNDEKWIIDLAYIRSVCRKMCVKYSGFRVRTGFAELKKKKIIISDEGEWNEKPSRN